MVLKTNRDKYTKQRRYLDPSKRFKYSYTIDYMDDNVCKYSFL